MEKDKNPMKSGDNHRKRRGFSTFNGIISFSFKPRNIKAIINAIFSKKEKNIECIYKTPSNKVQDKTLSKIGIKSIGTFRKYVGVSLLNYISDGELLPGACELFGLFYRAGYRTDVGSKPAVMVSGTGTAKRRGEGSYKTECLQVDKTPLVLKLV
jgi:hypothetical protein